MENSDRRVLATLKSKSRSLSLDNSTLSKLPDSLGRLQFLTSLSVKNNRLKSLNQLSKLTSLTYFNGGGNELDDDCLQHLVTCTQLIKLHLFKNRLTILSSQICCSCIHLKVLNLNWNSLLSLPKEVGQLKSLEQLSLSHNQLQSLPKTISSLELLRELHVDNNVLSNLPESLHKCSKLTKLMVHKNQLTELPDSIGTCRSLMVLDVSCNFLEMFPYSLNGNKKLKELYFDDNPLLPQMPIPSEQSLEVMQLREIAARAMVKRLESDDRWLKRLSVWNPVLADILRHAGKCALCGGPYVLSQLHCVQHVQVKKALPHVQVTTSGSSLITLPIYSPLCSYKCFNSPGHTFYAITTL